MRWFGVALAAGYLCGSGVRAAPVADLYHEPYRPQFHFSPPQQWMNDPNGLVYDQGEYHLFYQYNPYANTWGPMHWGHAVSKDSVHWENLPIALYPDRHGTIFSGSAVLDRDNTSGFGTRVNPPLVAMFTYHDHLSENLGHTGFQAQGLAYSLDRGRNWVKYEGNPVLTSPTIRDFRDPKLLWFAPRRAWIVALAVADHIAFYSSTDLQHWSHDGDFGQEWGSHAGVWECPDLIEMNVTGADASVPAAKKFVLLVSVGKGGPNGGSGTQYFVGEFNGHRFLPDGEASPAGRSSIHWFDYGTDDYAGSTWSGAAPHTAGPRFIGWMSNWQYATLVPTERWRSAMTVPRELTLVRTARGLALHSLPVSELATLRRGAATLPAQTVAAPLNLTRAAGIAGTLLELHLSLDTAAAALTELTFANSRGESTVFRIDKSKRRYELDRSHSGVVNFSKDFPGVQAAPLRGSAEHVALEILIERSSLEIFVNDGETVFTSLVFPTVPYDSITLRANREIRLNSSILYTLRSIWE